MNPPKYPYLTKTELGIFRCIYKLWLMNRRKTLQITWRNIHYLKGMSKWSINKVLRKLNESKLITRDFYKFGPKWGQPAKPMYSEGTFVSITDLGDELFKHTNHHNLVRPSKR